MRILLVITDLDLGGAETQVVRLAAGFTGRGHEVQVVSMIDPVAWQDRLKAAGVKVHSLGMKRGSPDPRGILALARIVRAFRPDVVHAHMLHANLLARVTRTIVNMPVLITTAHNTREGGRAFDIAYRATDALTDLSTNVSSAAVEAYVKRSVAPRERIRLVPNGISMDDYGMNAAGRESVRAELGWTGFVWLAIGRLTVEKDFANLLAAWKLPGPADQLAIVGSGPELGRLQELAQPSVTFLGRRMDVPRLLAAADGFVLPSRVEGLPMVLLEAAAARLPMVATDVGGNAEIVKDLMTGRLVPSRDPRALAEAMQWLQELAGDARRVLADSAFELVASTYGMESVIDLWEQTYAELR